MKAILRKGMAVCAALLMCANVMAQDVNFSKDLEGVFEGLAIPKAFIHDGHTRFVSFERDTETHDLKKVTILTNKFDAEKEFTSGALFEKYVTDRTISFVYGSNMNYTNYDATATGTYLTITQTLFNLDDKYEFFVPIMHLFEGVPEDDYDPIGYSIVSETGEVLQNIIVNEDKRNDMRNRATLVEVDGYCYLTIYCYPYGMNSDFKEVTKIYAINKESSSISFVNEVEGTMNISPTIADRDAQITITLNDDNSNVARELVVTGVNGQLVERRDIPAGENSVQIPASMLRSGMYNFTLQQKGQVVDNGKVIVK